MWQKGYHLSAESFCYQDTKVKRDALPTRFQVCHGRTGKAQMFGEFGLTQSSIQSGTPNPEPHKAIKVIYADISDFRHHSSPPLRARILPYRVSALDVILETSKMMTLTLSVAAVDERDA
nr:hypothetical protein [Herbidospora solisilvae]